MMARLSSPDLPQLESEWFDLGFEIVDDIAFVLPVTVDNWAEIQSIIDRKLAEILELSRECPCDACMSAEVSR